jgi:hypothetical protein
MRFYVFLGRQDLQDFGDFLSPAARGPSAEGRSILMILLKVRLWWVDPVQLLLLK